MNNNYSNRSFFLLVFAFSLLLLANSLIYFPFLSDDALISMRYSRRLVNNQGLTWTDGVAVEGYSNLLWLLFTAAGVAMGVDAITAVRLLGVFSILLFIFIILYYYRKSVSRSHLIVLLFAVLSAPLGVWAIGGLEQPLVALLLAISIPLAWRIIDMQNAPFTLYLTSSIPLALLCITRPDGTLFTIMALFVLLLAGKGKKSFLLVVLPLFFFLMQLAFRFYYYDDFVPNTARVKMAPSLQCSIGGIKYLIRGVVVLFPLSLFSLYATVKALRKSHYRTLLPAFMAMGWMFYLIVIGGDIFPAYRHFVPLVILFSWICIEEFPKFKRTNGTVFVFSLVLILFLGLQYFDSRNVAAREELWEWDGQVTALVLKEAFSEQQPLLAVTAAGSLPYWSELPSLDMLGLNDRYLALNQGNGPKTDLIGHNVCNPAYVLEREPDIISFNVAGAPSGLAVAESLFASTEFQTKYTKVLVEGDFPYSFTGTLWFLTDSPKIGIKRTNERIEIPAYFFNGFSHTSMICLAGTPGITISAERPASITLMDLPERENWEPAAIPSDYSITLEEENSALRIELTTDNIEPVFIQTIQLTRSFQ